uniref:Uncharacterized protein n=1 Tax=Chromera velia CCMP2878 TaxID=1169474 RepID=A0A0G4G215_9ALVE|eukprot:Cvel_19721.t1-p1 / transcript=Cvel_19721.t1 / gene=Cvel_19721 / organism=Chromera_velia_CCMP2878 / gene_product=Transmembrane protein FLJ37396, putative / transcript_product=Transmembrane protein FLJ37396, putative / location=Cvel_scaffold1723:9052-36827(-) / protein_length=3557 / sequence_SO=supercontig / SO=protein_coding / is_pseudo=false
MSLDISIDNILRNALEHNVYADTETSEMESKLHDLHQKYVDECQKYRLEHGEQGAGPREARRHFFVPAYPELMDKSDMSQFRRKRAEILKKVTQMDSPEDLGLMAENIRKDIEGSARLNNSLEDTRVSLLQTFIRHKDRMLSRKMCLLQRYKSLEFVEAAKAASRYEGPTASNKQRGEEPLFLPPQAFTKIPLAVASRRQLDDLLEELGTLFDNQVSVHTDSGHAFAHQVFLDFPTFFRRQTMRNKFFAYKNIMVEHMKTASTKQKSRNDLGISDESDEEVFEEGDGRGERKVAGARQETDPDAIIKKFKLYLKPSTWLPFVCFFPTVDSYQLEQRVLLAYHQHLPTQPRLATRHPPVESKVQPSATASKGLPNKGPQQSGGPGGSAGIRLPGTHAKASIAAKRIEDSAEQVRGSARQPPPKSTPTDLLVDGILRAEADFLKCEDLPFVTSRLFGLADSVASKAAASVGSLGANNSAAGGGAAAVAVGGSQAEMGQIQQQGSPHSGGVEGKEEGGEGGSRTRRSASLRRLGSQQGVGGPPDERSSPKGLPAPAIGKIFVPRRSAASHCSGPLGSLVGECLGGVWVSALVVCGWDRATGEERLQWHQLQASHSQNQKTKGEDGEEGDEGENGDENNDMGIKKNAGGDSQTETLRKSLGGAMRGDTIAASSNDASTVFDRLRSQFFGASNPVVPDLDPLHKTLKDFPLPNRNTISLKEAQFGLETVEVLKSDETLIRDEHDIPILHESALADLNRLETDMLVMGSFFIQQYERKQEEERKLKSKQPDPAAIQPSSLPSPLDNTPSPQVDRVGVLLDILESEFAFHDSKRQLIDVYREILEHTSDLKERKEIAQRMTDVMAQRPRLDFDDEYFAGRSGGRWVGGARAKGGRENEKDRRKEKSQRTGNEDSSSDLDAAEREAEGIEITPPTSQSRRSNALNASAASPTEGEGGARASGSRKHALFARVGEGGSTFLDVHEWLAHPMEGFLHPTSKGNLEGLSDVRLVEGGSSIGILDFHESVGLAWKCETLIEEGVKEIMSSFRTSSVKHVNCLERAYVHFANLLWAERTGAQKGIHMQTPLGILEQIAKAPEDKAGVHSIFSRPDRMALLKKRPDPAEVLQYHASWLLSQASVVFSIAEEMQGPKAPGSLRSPRSPRLGGGESPGPPPPNSPSPRRHGGGGDDVRNGPFGAPEAGPGGDEGGEEGFGMTEDEIRLTGSLRRNLGDLKKKSGIELVLSVYANFLEQIRLRIEMSQYLFDNAILESVTTRQAALFGHVVDSSFRQPKMLPNGETVFAEPLSISQQQQQQQEAEADLEMRNMALTPSYSVLPFKTNVTFRPAASRIDQEIDVFSLPDVEGLRLGCCAGKLVEMCQVLQHERAFLWLNVVCANLHQVLLTGLMMDKARRDVLTKHVHVGSMTAPKSVDPVGLPVMHRMRRASAVYQTLARQGKIDPAIGGLLASGGAGAGGASSGNSEETDIALLVHSLDLRIKEDSRLLHGLFVHPFQELQPLQGAAAMLWRDRVVTVRTAFFGSPEEVQEQGLRTLKHRIVSFLSMALAHRICGLAVQYQTAVLNNSLHDLHRLLPVEVSPFTTMASRSKIIHMLDREEGAVPNEEETRREEGETEVSKAIRKAKETPYVDQSMQCALPFFLHPVDRIVEMSPFEPNARIDPINIAFLADAALPDLVPEEPATGKTFSIGAFMGESSTSHGNAKKDQTSGAPDPPPGSEALSLEMDVPYGGPCFAALRLYSSLHALISLRVALSLLDVDAASVIKHKRWTYFQPELFRGEATYCNSVAVEALQPLMIEMGEIRQEVKRIDADRPSGVYAQHRLMFGKAQTGLWKLQVVLRSCHSHFLKKGLMEDGAEVLRWQWFLQGSALRQSGLSLRTALPLDSPDPSNVVVPQPTEQVMGEDPHLAEGDLDLKSAAAPRTDPLEEAKRDTARAQAKERKSVVTLMFDPAVLGSLDEVYASHPTLHVSSTRTKHASLQGGAAPHLRQTRELPFVGTGVGRNGESVTYTPQGVAQGLGRRSSVLVSEGRGSAETGLLSAAAAAGGGGGAFVGPGDIPAVLGSPKLATSIDGSKPENLMAWHAVYQTPSRTSVYFLFSDTDETNQKKESLRGAPVKHETSVWVAETRPDVRNFALPYFHPFLKQTFFASLPLRMMDLDRSYGVRAEYLRRRNPLQSQQTQGPGGTVSAAAGAEGGEGAGMPGESPTAAGGVSSTKSKCAAYFLKLDEVVTVSAMGGTATVPEAVAGASKVLGPCGFFPWALATPSLEGVEALLPHLPPPRRQHAAGVSLELEVKLQDFLLSRGHNKLTHPWENLFSEEEFFRTLLTKERLRDLALSVLTRIPWALTREEQANREDIYRTLFFLPRDELELFVNKHTDWSTVKGVPVPDSRDGTEPNGRGSSSSSSGAVGEEGGPLGKQSDALRGAVAAGDEEGLEKDKAAADQQNILPCDTIRATCMDINRELGAIYIQTTRLICAIDKMIIGLAAEACNREFALVSALKFEEEAYRAAMTAHSAASRHRQGANESRTAAEVRFHNATAMKLMEKRPFVTKVDVVLQFINRLRSRGTFVRTSSGERGYVFAEKDLNECTEDLGRRLIVWGVNWLTSRTRTENDVVGMLNRRLQVQERGKKEGRRDEVQMRQASFSSTAALIIRDLRVEARETERRLRDEIGLAVGQQLSDLQSQVNFYSGRFEEFKHALSTEVTGSLRHLKEASITKLMDICESFCNEAGGVPQVLKQQLTDFREKEAPALAKEADVSKADFHNMVLSAKSVAKERDPIRLTFDEQPVLEYLVAVQDKDANSKSPRRGRMGTKPMDPAASFRGGQTGMMSPLAASAVALPANDTLAVPLGNPNNPNAFQVKNTLLLSPLYSKPKSLQEAVGSLKQRQGQALNASAGVDAKSSTRGGRYGWRSGQTKLENPFEMASDTDGREEEDDGLLTDDSADDTSEEGEGRLSETPGEEGAAKKKKKKRSARVGWDARNLKVAKRKLKKLGLDAEGVDQMAPSTARLLGNLAGRDLTEVSILREMVRELMIAAVKLRTFTAWKTHAMGERMRKELREIRLTMSNNLMLWEKMHELKDRESMAREELQKSSHELSVTRSRAEYLKLQLAVSRDKCQKLQTWKSMKSKRLTELEGEVAANEKLRGFNAEKLMKILQKKEERIRELESLMAAAGIGPEGNKAQQQPQQGGQQHKDGQGGGPGDGGGTKTSRPSAAGSPEMSAVERSPQRNMVALKHENDKLILENKRLKKQVSRERELKEEAFSKLNLFRSELEEGGFDPDKVAALWRARCEEMADLMQQLQDDNQQLRAEMSDLTGIYPTQTAASVSPAATRVQELNNPAADPRAPPSVPRNAAAAQFAYGEIPQQAGGTARQVGGGTGIPLTSRSAAVSLGSSPFHVPGRSGGMGGQGAPLAFGRRAPPVRGGGGASAGRAASGGMNVEEILGLDPAATSPAAPSQGSRLYSATGVRALSSQRPGGGGVGFSEGEGGGPSSASASSRFRVNLQYGQGKGKAQAQAQAASAKQTPRVFGTSNPAGTGGGGAVRPARKLNPLPY